MLADSRDQHGTKWLFVQLLPPLRPPPPLAPGRLLQRGGQLFLWGSGVGQQQVAEARLQPRGVRAVFRFGGVEGVHARRIRPGVSGGATVAQSSRGQRGNAMQYNPALDGHGCALKCGRITSGSKHAAGPCPVPRVFTCVDIA